MDFVREVDLKTKMSDIPIAFTITGFLFFIFAIGYLIYISSITPDLNVFCKQEFGQNAKSYWISSDYGYCYIESHNNITKYNTYLINYEWKVIKNE